MRTPARSATVGRCSGTAGVDGGADVVGVGVDQREALRLKGEAPHVPSWQSGAAFTVKPGTPLFPRIDDDRKTALLAAWAPKPAAPAAPAAAPQQAPAATQQSAAASQQPAATQQAPAATQQIDYADFAKLDLRVALVEAAERVPKKDKLLKLTVDLGEAEPRRAVVLAEEGLALAPQDLGLWRMLGAARLAAGDAAGAVVACEQLLLRAPADADGHFQHAIALQRGGDVPGAARAYQRALTFAPDMIAADFNLGVLFQQAGNANAATAAYRHVLAADPKHVAAYKNLGEVLFARGDVDGWLANFHAFEKHCPKALAVAVYALEACQHAADFERLDRYLDGLRSDAYEARDPQEMVDCLEELLYLLLFYDVEPSLMLRLAQAYDAAAPKVYGAPLPAARERKPGPLRVGYLSADLRNHVMGKMMWQAIQHHDARSVECHFYSSSPVRDEWTERFASKGRLEVIAALDDDAAARRIAADDLDILVDLSTHTRGARPGILARKPARVQITHVASAGTVGLSAIDFKLTDQETNDLIDFLEFTSRVKTQGWPPKASG